MRRIALNSFNYKGNELTMLGRWCLQIKPAPGDQVTEMRGCLSLAFFVHLLVFKKKNWIAAWGVMISWLDRGDTGVGDCPALWCGH